MLFMPWGDQWRIQTMSYKVGIQLLLILVLGSMSLVTLLTMSLACKYLLPSQDYVLYSVLCVRSNSCNICLFFSCSDLGNAKLSGNLVPELGNLEHLQYLWVIMSCLLNYVGTVKFNLVMLFQELIWFDLRKSQQLQFPSQWNNYFKGIIITMNEWMNVKFGTFGGFSFFFFVNLIYCKL